MMLERNGYRPCIVKSKKALFHCISYFATTTNNFAIVEYEDGTMEAVPIEWIKFIDNPFADYCWDNADPFCIKDPEQIKVVDNIGKVDKNKKLNAKVHITKQKILRKHLTRRNNKNA